MGYKLGRRSLGNLSGVHPIMVAIVCLAILKTKRDFTVIDGVRTIEEQKALFASGDSETMKSKHLPQKDGFGHAVDLLPLFDGKGSYKSMEAFGEVKVAMDEAADELGVNIIWGNDWDDDGIPVRQDPDENFVDAPHFQLDLGA
ncbi:MAG: M15 family metallopeptidase [Desulfovibrio sp.]